MGSILHVAVLTAFIAVSLSIQQHVKIPRTKFSCEGRVSGYYADLETGCQVYHMCDGLGRQFSYSCPNTTLFQQRMLICDHWYMVNCSASEKDYSANLLIGQRDKPFVSDSEDHQRTPRPDILSAPYAQGFNNYGGFQELITSASGKNGLDNSVANGNNELNDGIQHFPLPTHWSTELSNINRYTTAAPKINTQGFTGKPIIIESEESENTLNGNSNGLIAQSTEHSRFVSHTPIFNRGREKITTNKPAFHPQVTNNNNPSQDFNTLFTTNLETDFGVTPPSKFLNPPILEANSPDPDEKFSLLKSTTVKSISSFNNELLSELLPPVSVETSGENQSNEDRKTDDAVFKFIKRFNTDEVVPEPIKSNPINRNDFTSGGGFGESGPSGKGFEIQSSSETAGFATQSGINNQILNQNQKINQDVERNQQPKETTKAPEELFKAKIVAKPNKPTDFNQNSPVSSINSNEIVPPAVELLPPFTEYSEIVSSTMGPIIYYEWKWAAPAQELEPPFPPAENEKDNIQKRGQESKKIEGRPDFAKPRPSTPRPDPQPTQRSAPDQATSEGNIDFKSSAYFIPNYVFPLDKQHPGYQEDGAITSFQVRIPQALEENEAHPYYGENAQCPQCHPSFVVPGTCKPCVMIRR